MSSKLDLTVLLTQTAWTRSLARSLAGDAHLAEDLVQDAWVAALERPPDLGRPVRGWLASVLRNRWLDLRRSRERRDARERSAAADEAWPSSHDVVEKASAQRELVQAVLELDEPYRTTVLLRFFEELPQREIARRMQTSTVTVNSRLTRALAKLRERMSAGGGRTAWLRVLVPLLREPAAAPAVALGAGAMKAVLTSVVVAASVLAGIVLWTSHGDEPLVASSSAVVSGEASALEPPEAASTSVAVDTPPEPPAQRTPVVGEGRERTLEQPPSPAPTARTVRGRVLDATGSALAGVDLVLSSASSKAACTSKVGGWFEIALDVPADAIVSADPRFVTVLAGSARVRDSTLPTVVVAPRIDLSGRVLDEAHMPLAAASLELCLPTGFGAEWGVPLDYSLPQHWRVRSRDDGTFQLAAVPAIAASVIGVALAGFAPHAEEAPLRSTSALDIVLSRPGPATGLVRGVVLDPVGARVEDARVSAGEAIALTDARGEFTLDVRLKGSDERLVALKAGLLPAVLEPTRDRDGGLLWPAEVVLQLGGPAGTVTGRVVDAEGDPIADAKVWIDDPTSFGRSAEARLAVESVLRGDERFWSYVQTGSDGTFAIEGLLERAYRLQAVDPRTLASAETEPVTAADSPVELRLPTDDTHERVAGRVVTAAGRPIPGVSVRLFRLTYEVEHESGTDNEAQEGPPVVTDEDGAFEFRSVPRKGVNVTASGDTILFAGAVLEEEPDPRSIEIVASLRLHVQVELDEPFERADRLRVFDADGGRVLLRVFHGKGANADFEMPILDGRSRVISVEEDAATLALYRGEEEVARIPLSLVPGQTNRVRY